MIEVTGLKGEFEVFLYDKEGKLKAYRNVKNMTVDSGFAAVCDMMGQGGVEPFKYCAIGDGTNAPTSGDTILASELARTLGSYNRSSSTIWTNEATFDPGVGTGTITESGLFNASSGGTLLCRQTFGAITKGAADTLVVTWRYTLS